MWLTNHCHSKMKMAEIFQAHYVHDMFYNKYKLHVPCVFVLHPNLYLWNTLWNWVTQFCCIYYLPTPGRRLRGYTQAPMTPRTGSLCGACELHYPSPTRRPIPCALTEFDKVAGSPLLWIFQRCWWGIMWHSRQSKPRLACAQCHRLPGNGPTKSRASSPQPCILA